MWGLDMHRDDSQTRWIYLPIARVRRRGFCETSRCRGKRAVATTFHAVINVPGDRDQGWLACGECTRMMIEVA
jgi:hypothetical protein